MTHASQTAFASLFHPLDIGGMTIPNRFCAGPLTLPSLQGPQGEFSSDGLAFFEARAKGGFGLLYTGAFHPDVLVDPVHPLDSKQPLKAPKTFRRTAIELLERLDAYGAKMLPQVSMGYGRNAVGCYGPSEIPYYHDPSQKTPALTQDQIHQKIDQMIATAAFLKTCGFPGIEVHAMHWGYLLDQFALSYMNHRTDAYGGALENRLRCAREIVEGVKAACGQDFVVSMRLALKTYLQDYNKPALHGENEVGRTLEEGLLICQKLEAYGYDCLSVDFGQYDSFYYAAPPCYMEKGRILSLAEQAKRVVSIPILCGGRMNDPYLAAEAVAAGKIDAVVLARPSLADPDYPQKVFRGVPEDIRPCIGCNQGCIGALKLGRRAGCAVNPEAAREATFTLSPALEKKHVLVVGGGPAGMEAARVAALRGHTVTLCEAEKTLGGALRQAGAHDFKQDLHDLAAWYERQLAKHAVTVECSTRLDAEAIAARHPDAVILALGGRPVIPPVPGIARAVDALTALHPDSTLSLGETVAVIGGGLVGCELALDCARKGKQVTLIEALPRLLSGSLPVPESNEQMLLDLLHEAHVTIHTETRLTAVTEEAVQLTDPTGTPFSLPAATVLLATGFAPQPSLAHELLGTGIAVYEIGDSHHPGSVLTAIGEGYTVGRAIS